jgi:NADH-quinone oxidoreductase subunit F
VTTTVNGPDLGPLLPLLEQYRGRGREALLPLLHDAQAVYGWLPRPVQQAIGETLRVPLADVHGVIEFYTMFYNEPTANRVVRVCEDVACRLAGCDKLMAAFEDHLGLGPGQTSPDQQITYEYSPCLGLCEVAPAVLVGNSPAGRVRPEDVPALLDSNHPGPELSPGGEPLWMLGRVGKVDPYSLESYRAAGGYRVLGEVVQLEPDVLIERLSASGILGRGGAMFPLGRKLRFTRDAAGSPSEKHIVVNADESEPGTFKDRYLLEGDPFAVLEAATVAGYAVGAENGWIFVRGEYPRVIRRLGSAIAECRRQGLLGQNILGRQGFSFDIQLRVGAGAYICGEETALFEAIEGKRGFPRIKPPFPVTHGLFGQPTSISNVETLVGALSYLAVGHDAWRSVGTEGSPGTKLFCLSGDVVRPGLYEFPFGVTAQELIDRAGGVKEGRAVQAVLMGGAAGVFVGPEKLGIPLTYEDLRQHNIPLGSGVVMVFDEEADMRQVLYHISHFFAHESCGKCFPCQLGTQRQMEILKPLAHGRAPRLSDMRDLQDIGFAMTQTSLCGLGQTAAAAILSAIELWPELVK